MQFPHLFSPLRIGRVTVPNRISFSAHLTNLAADGLPTRAADRLPGGPRPRRHGPHHHRGAVGPPHRPGLRAPDRGLPARGDPAATSGSRGAVHAYDTRIFAQLNHNGQQCSGSLSRLPVWAPSPIPDVLYRESPKAMEPEDIQEVIEHFARSAVHVREGGFDGVELQFGHSSLARQFMSPLTNFRGDEYGGEFENRMRFALELVAAVRAAVGPDFTLGRPALRRRAHPRRPHPRGRQADRPASAGHRRARLLQPLARHLLQPVPGRRPDAPAARATRCRWPPASRRSRRCRCSPPGASTTRPWPSGCSPTGRPT